MKFYTKIQWVENRGNRWFIKIHIGIRCLVLFDNGWFDKICDMVKYLICEKMVWQIVLIITFQESGLTEIILYLLKKYRLFITL